MLRFKQFLIERPSIEDQIETGNRTIIDVANKKRQGYARAGNIKVPFDITVDPKLPPEVRGRFGQHRLAVTRHLYPKAFEGQEELKSQLALNSDIDVNNSDFRTAVKSQDIVAHEAGHAHQLASQMRDAEVRNSQGKSTYADVETGRSSSAQQSSSPRLANLSPKVKADMEYSSYFFDPEEVNARSAGAGTMAYRIRLGGGDRSYSFGYPKIGSEVALKFLPGGERASPEEMSAMTRHERSVAKRNQLQVQRDLRAAAARGVLKAEQEMATPSPDAEATKARQAAIQSKVEALKGKTTKIASVAGKAASIMDPAGEVASQVLPRAASAAGLGAEVAMGAAMIPLAVGAFTQQAGDPMGDFKAGFAPGEFEKWQEEQEETRKRQNASSVQSLINRPYDPNQASSRRRQQ
jgi:hypothetical protein